MALEIDNITRSLQDVNRAFLSLEAKIKTPKQAEALSNTKNAVSELEHQTRILEYEMENG